MTHALDPYSASRWLAVRNDDATACPAFGVMKVTGVDSDEGVFLVVRPDADSLAEVLVNGPVAIPAGEYGQGTRSEPLAVLYETSDGAPAAGAAWGTVQDSWKLGAGKTGFRALGAPASGNVGQFTYLGPGGAGGGDLTIEEADGSPSYPGIHTIRFDQADGFVVTQPAAGVARVDLSGVTVAYATPTVSGIVSSTSDGPDPQTFGGHKRFQDEITLLDSDANTESLIHFRDQNGDGLSRIIGYQHASGLTAGISLLAAATDAVGTTIQALADAAENQPGLWITRVGGEGDTDPPRIFLANELNGSSPWEGASATTGGLTFVSGLYTGGTATGGLTEEEVQDLIDAYAQPLDADLTALAGLTGTGVVCRTADDTYAVRTLMGESGVLSISNGGGVAGNPTFTVDANGIGDAKLRQSAGLSVIGRSANSTGNVADLTAGSDGHVLRRSGTALGFGTVATAGIGDAQVTYAKIQNVSATARVLGRKTSGAGVVEECTLSEVLDFIGSAAQGDILYRGSSAWARLGAGTSGHFLQTQGAGADPQWAAPSAASEASVAEMEAATASSTYVSPRRAKDHPGACKAWVQFDGTGTPATTFSYNVSSITDNGTGDYSVNWDTDFSGSAYATFVDCSSSGSSGVCIGGGHNSGAKAAGSYRVRSIDFNSAADFVDISVGAFGDHA